MILIMEMLTSAAQLLGQRQLTPVTMATTWLEMRLVSAYTVGNGVDMHQSANVSSYVECMRVCVSLYTGTDRGMELN